MGWFHWSTHHSATLKTVFNDILINFDPNKSFYMAGTVDENTNDFIDKGNRKDLSSTTQITTDGIYHLHLVDMVGNVYDSYLELGLTNWKIKG